MRSIKVPTFSCQHRASSILARKNCGNSKLLWLCPSRYISSRIRGWSPLPYHRTHGHTAVLFRYFWLSAAAHVTSHRRWFWYRRTPAFPLVNPTQRPFPRAPHPWGGGARRGGHHGPRSVGLSLPRGRCIPRGRPLRVHLRHPSRTPRARRRNLHPWAPARWPHTASYRRRLRALPPLPAPPCGRAKAPAD